MMLFLNFTSSLNGDGRCSRREGRGWRGAGAAVQCSVVQCGLSKVNERKLCTTSIGINCGANNNSLDARLRAAKGPFTLDCGASGSRPRHTLTYYVKIVFAVFLHEVLCAPMWYSPFPSKLILFFVHNYRVACLRTYGLVQTVGTKVIIFLHKFATPEQPSHRASQCTQRGRH